MDIQLAFSTKIEDMRVKLGRQDEVQDDMCRKLRDQPATSQKGESYSPAGRYPKSNLTKSKGIDKVGRYGGQPERFASWKYKMEVFLESEEPGYSGFIRWLEDMDGDVMSNDLDRYQALNSDVDVPFLSSQLYLILVATLEESSGPLAKVQNFHEKPEIRGAGAWQAVVGDAIGMSRLRLQALLE